ncbi:NlpC/P60 family protein [uncultured Phocaeicola sp.]|uniref:C40 family peptidase n=1 Tax=uncultured Phocaeicola sp. TaxID=990718 RepID=UPI0025AE6261|nr:NlpC/P60 family protein [uncultured Phocaeicola sp.]
MNIKKVDDKPMVIHTKEKPKLHVKGTPETKIKGRNVLTVQHGPKIAGTVAEKSIVENGRIKLKKSSVHVTDKRKTGQTKTVSDSMEYGGRNGTVQGRKESSAAQGRSCNGNVQNRKGSVTVQDRSVYGTVPGRKESGAAQDKRESAGTRGRNTDGNTQGRQGKEQEVRQSVNKENSMYAKQTGFASYRKSKAEKEAAIKKKTPVSSAVVSVAAKTTLDEMEGGSEVYEAYMAADTLAKPATNAARAGRNLYRSQVAKAKAQKIKKKKSGSRIREKAIKESAVKTARKTAQTAAKETAKETGKKVAKETSKAAAKTAAATAGTGAGGVLAGIAAGEAVGIAMDKRDVKNSTRNRMIKLFVAKMRQEENQDNIGKALKDIVLMRFSMMAKYIVRYVGLFLLSLFAIVAIIALPVIAVIAIIYNSPLAIFFPSISSGETTQEVLSAYVSEFNDAVNAELADYAGYDTSEKIYVNFEGSGTPDNFCDILMVYMVKHGDGDTATDMTDKAKQNLKAVFDDMCSYTITSRTDTETDDEGNTTTTTVKEVNVELKSCYDMISVYGFNAEEQAMLAELMKPEYLAMIGYTGGGGDPGEGISPEQYQAIVDAISDENGKKVVAFALSKVGYPYSQAYRDSGDYYDCSSLAYYAWRSAGVSIMYEGSNTAASEGKLCYDNNLLVNYDEMQPGDLIFYSYDRNGRFMNITHVAIYVGNGKVVEAANARLGVVYRPVQGRSSIVFIGRPR